VIEVKHRLFELVQEKEKALGRRLSFSDIAKGSNVSVKLVTRWLDPDVPTTRFDAHVISGFCHYFNCDISDLLYLERVEQ